MESPSTNVLFKVARLDASTTHHTTGDDPSYCLILECKFTAGGKTSAHQAAGRIDALPLRPALEIMLLPKGWGIQQTRRRRNVSGDRGGHSHPFPGQVQPRPLPFLAH